MAQFPNVSNDTRSMQVLVRFCLRIIILGVFAALGGLGFGRNLAALLWLTTILCVAAGLLRREGPFEPVLTHWDESATYGALYCLTAAFNQAATS
ncbi:MAG: hypothetical protein K2X60_13660 [Xanthobacteraceae bacterium]|nr:hypothetical protein [Xanthobacteraceae bacterium]